MQAAGQDRVRASRSVDTAELARSVSQLGSENPDERKAAHRSLAGLRAAHAPIDLLPALIVLRSDSNSRVRAWAANEVRALGMEDPAVATALPDARLVAEVIRAYVQPLDFAAMPVLVRLVNAEKLQVREAARFAVSRFGKNAIWQLRELYGEVKGQAADRAWDAERTAKELYATLDRPETEHADVLMASGLAAFLRDDLQAMQGDYDALLASYPRYAQRAKLAPGYAALGQSLYASDRLEEARAAYQRALRLAPDAPEAQRLAGQIAFLDAEIAQSRGVVDLHGYAEALKHAPGLTQAAEASDRLSGVSAARERDKKRLAAAAGIVVLLLLATLLLKQRRPAAVAG